MSKAAEYKQVKLEISHLYSDTSHYAMGTYTIAVPL